MLCLVEKIAILLCLSTAICARHQQWHGMDATPIRTLRQTFPNNAAALRPALICCLSANSQLAFAGTNSSTTYFTYDVNFLVIDAFQDQIK